MAIRYTPKYNAEIRRIVHNFNQTRNRAEKSGVPKNRIPNPVKVSELKANYKTKQELERVLNQLKRFSIASTNKRITIDNNFKTTKWNYDFLKGNRNIAKKYFEDEFKRVEKRVSNFAGERDYLNTISAKIDVLGKDINKLDDREFLASVRAVEEFMASPSIRKEKYRNFLTVVEDVMETVGIKKDKRDVFFKKFEQLTPTQFLYAYDNNDIIARVYALYFKRDSEGDVILNTTTGSAEELIDNLYEQVDYIIDDAKSNSV